VFEVFVIGPDLDGVRGSLEVVSPGLEGANDRKQFFIIDVVVPLWFRERLGEVSNGVPEVVVTALGQHASGSKVGGIDFNLVGLSWIRHERSLQLSERSVALSSPEPWIVFLGQIEERTRDLGEVAYKATVEVAEPEECLNILDAFGDRPVCDSSDLDRVHCKLVMRNNEPEVLDL
ncbi:hypothetical protein K466DRAFT_468796, partial [Polyporus arcularius HHB13444]